MEAADRSRNERNREDLRSQQAKKCHQQVREGVTLEVPIHDLKPLQTLNTYRRDLGLGPSRNLISSAIYNYDPTAIAEYYEKLALGDSSSSSSARSSTQREIETNPFGLPGLPIRSLGSDCDSQEPDDHEENDGSTSHKSSCGGDDDSHPKRTAVAGRLHRVHE
ncbi:hypothetical protein F5B18DRAFT_676867 [Nemania serpens]|nr:hypothetical protein F5B18DRAFT_676867 [Nemania serpens]